MIQIYDYQGSVETTIVLCIVKRGKACKLQESTMEKLKLILYHRHRVLLYVAPFQ